ATNVILPLSLHDALPISSLRRYRLLHDVARASRIDLHARAHGCGHRHRADVAALSRRRLGPDQLLEHRGVVLEQQAIVEVALAEDRKSHTSELQSLAYLV